MQPNYKEQPLKEEINDPAGDSSKLTKETKKRKQLADSIKLAGDVDPFVKTDLGSDKQQSQEELQSKQKLVKYNEDVIKRVEDIFQKEIMDNVSTNEPYSEEWYNDETTRQNVSNAFQKLQDIKSSFPKRVHDRTESLLVSEQLDAKRQELESAFIQKYNKTSNQVLEENKDVPTKPGESFENNVPNASTELLEARTLNDFYKLSDQLKNDDIDQNYWNDIKWNESFEKSLTPKFVSGLTRDLYRAVLEGIGVNSIGMPVTPEGRQHASNNIYQFNYNQLPEDSFIKQGINQDGVKSMLNFTLMSKMPYERPFVIEAMKSVTSSLAALPFYMTGLNRLGLITKTGESGLFTLGAKEFGKNLLKAPFYTQPFRLATDSIEAINNAKDYGDIFTGLGKAYLNGLAEVIGEVSTPILAKGLGKFKVWNKINESVEKSLQQLSGKFNTNLNTAVDWLMISPVTETFEEEISNVLNNDPNIFGGDFDLKRLSIEAISSLGMGVPIGIVSAITKNKIENQIKNSDGFKQYLNEETLRDENPTVDDYFEWLNEKEKEQNKQIQDNVSQTYETETTKKYKSLDEITSGIIQFGIQKSEQSKELQDEIEQRVQNPTQEDLDIVKPETILQSIRNVFGTQSQPEEVTLPMVSNEVPENISSNSKGLLGALTNPTVLSKQKGNIQNDYPVNFKGQTFADSEAAYQKFKTGNTEEDYKLMVDVITAKLQQHPRLVEETKKKGGLDWINSTRHSISESYDKKSRWTGVGQNSLFIKALAEAYQNVTSPQTQDENVVFRDKDIKAIHGDSVQELKKMQSNSVDVVFTDPPYGIDYGYPEFQDTKENVKQLINDFLPEARRVGKLVVLTPGYLAEELYPEPDAKIEWYNTGKEKQDIYIYGKVTPEKIQQVKDYIFESKTRVDFTERHKPADIPLLKERIELLKEMEKENNPILKEQNLDVQREIEKAQERIKWAIDVPMKPVRFWTGLLNAIAIKGNTIVDPFMGTGTTLFAAKKLGMKAIGYDISPKTLDYSKMLFEKYFGNVDKNDIMDYALLQKKYPEIFNQIIEPLKNNGFVLTGSLELSQHGTIYRKNQVPHDLDFRVGSEFLSNLNINSLEELGTYLSNLLNLPVTPAFEWNNKGLLNGTLQQFKINLNEADIILDVFIMETPETTDEGVFDAKFRAGRLKDLRDFFNFQQKEVQQINIDETVTHTFKQQEQSPNIEQLDKESQLENTSGLNYKQSSDGLLDMLRKQNLDLKTHGIDTPEKFFSWIQSFKTGNHTLDWLKFQVAWIEKFGSALDQPTKLQSNRTLLQEVFVSFYHSSKKPAVKLTIKNNTVKVEQYTGNSYVDADGIQKSLFGQEELWEKVQDILPEGSTVYRINQVQFGNIYNSFLDIKDQPLDVVMVRNELLKQGYYWTGILPNSNTSLLIDIQNLIPDSPNKDNVDKWYAELDMFVGQALLNITDQLIKTKRIKATTGESPSAFIFPDLQDKLSKLTPASNVYYTQVDGKDQINYKYVVLDDSTVPQEFLSSLGDGEEYITPFLAEVIWDANGTPYIKRGAIKPKYFDLGVFWKWARKIRPPKSKMDYFMQKNGIASIVFSSTIKVGKPENMITWEQLNTQQTISKDLIMEHNILEDSNLMDKGKISKKAAGIGPNIMTTGIMHFLSRQGQNDVKQWLNQDFIELQNEFAKYIQDPYALEKEILSYVNDMDFSDDVTELIKSLENYPYAMRLPVVMDFIMKGNFKEKMFDAARHFKKGSSPAYVLDLGPLSNYKALEGADPEAFDDKGYLKPGYIIIDAFTAKKFKYSIGDKAFTALNPPGAFVDLRAEKIAAILPEKMGANQLVGSILSYQDASGKDGDIDTINLIYVGTELDKKVWQHIKSANLEERYKEMMEKFKDKNTAKNILMFLNKDNPDYKSSEKEIQAWEKIAPLVRMEDNNDGVFALNTDFSKLTFENPDHWKGVQILSKEGLIGQLYNWKAIYTLFLENDYNLNGITANPDTNFTLPMLKQLTDMALDWTNTLDIAKIKFNWQDLVGKLFSFPKQYDKNTFASFEKALRPIKDAIVLTKQKDRGGDKFDYISYHEAISKAKQQLNALPSGLENSILSMTIDGLEQIHLPKLALTMPQINNVYNKLTYTMLGVPEGAVESNTKTRAIKLGYDYTKKKSGGMAISLDVIKALSRLGTYTNTPEDELKNIRLLRFLSEDNLKAGRTNPLALSHPVTSVFNDWLNKVMETPTAKQDSLGKSVTIGQTRKNGYRYKFTNVDGELQYEILSVADNNIVNSETFTDWKSFREKGGIDLNNWLVSEEIINLFKDIVETSGNKIVKTVSDDLLKEIFPKIIDRESFQKANKNIKESFYYAVLGLIKANDWGLQVTDRPGMRNPIDANRFIKPSKSAKESVTSFAKPIAFLENFAYKDDVAIEVLIKFKRTVNALIEQEIHKEQELETKGKSLNSLLIPVIPPVLSDSKKVTLEDILRLTPHTFSTPEEQQEWLDKVVRENVATDNDKKLFEKLVLKGLSQADTKYKFWWRAAMFNPYVNSHVIPFDVFVDMYGKKDKLYRGNDVVYQFPVNGRLNDVTANEIDITFRHWSLGIKAKLVSSAQTFWFVQHSLDRSYEMARIQQEQLVDSVSKFVFEPNELLDKSDRSKILKDAKIYDAKFIKEYLVDIWDKAEDMAFRNSLQGFDLSQDVQAYYDFAMGKQEVKSLDAKGKPVFKTTYSDLDPKSVRTKVGAMKYRHMFDVVVPKMLDTQITNMQLVQDLALKNNNLNAYNTAQAFIEEIQTMKRQMESINSTSSYMPHTWDSKAKWMEARVKIYEKTGVTTKEAEKKAKKDWEDKEVRNSIVGGLGNYVDTFFLTREANMDGYLKTPETATRYFNQLNRLLRFQHLFAMEELMDDQISNEIPFMYKHAKEMAARVRGADKYGRKTSFENVKPGDLVLFTSNLGVNEYVAKHIREQKMDFVTANKHLLDKDETPEKEQKDPIDQITYSKGKDHKYLTSLNYKAGMTDFGKPTVDRNSFLANRLYSFVFKKLNGIDIPQYVGQPSNQDVINFFHKNKRFINSNYVDFGGEKDFEVPDKSYPKIKDVVYPTKDDMDAYKSEWLRSSADVALLNHKWKIEALMKWQNVNIDGKKAENLVIGKVEQKNQNQMTVNGTPYNKLRVSNVQTLWGNSVESRARIIANKLGFNVNADREMLPVVAKYLLKMQASSMLTGSTFAARNVIGGKLQETIFFGRHVMKLANQFIGSVGMDSLLSEKNETQKEQFRMIYDNSVALLGNIDEIMGKFGTIVSALSEVNGIPSDQLDEMIRLGTNWNQTKEDLKAMGVDTKLRFNKGQFNGNAVTRLDKFWQSFVKFSNLNFLSNSFFDPIVGKSSLTNPGVGEKQLRFHTAIAAVEMHSMLDINNPQEKKLLIAFIDQAIRNTQFLYRVGLDQGMLESSPIARTLWVNYKHYPISSFCTSFYYLDNWFKQKKEYKGRLIGIKNEENYKKEYGTHSLPNELIINEGTPDEETIVFQDTRYASVVRRMVTTKILLQMLNTGSKIFKLKAYGQVASIADVLLHVADITSTSYTLTGSSAIAKLAFSLLSTLIPDPDDEDKVSKLKRVLHLTQQEYLDGLKDKKWAEDVSDKIINSQYTQNLIKECIEDIPFGVSESNTTDALLASLLSGSLLPDNYQELALTIANTYLPLRPLRNPLLGNIVGIFNPEVGNEIKYPLNLGYNPLHTIKVKYDKQKAREKNNKSTTKKPTFKTKPSAR